MPIVKDKFRQLVENHLLPMFPRSKLYEVQDAKGKKLVVTESASEMFIKPFIEADYGLKISRKQAFNDIEKKIISAFQLELSSIADAIDKPYEKAVTRTLRTRVAMRSLAADGDVVLIALLMQIVDQLHEWSSATYEGRRFSVAVGVDPANETDDGSTLSELWQQKYAPLISNGYDTIIECSKHGRITKIRALQENGAIELNDSRDSFSPFRFSRLAAWTRGGKYAFALRKDGAVLVFKQGSVVFVLEKNNWTHFDHEAALKSLYPKDYKGASEPIKRELYNTILDVSFAKTGGCFGFVSSSDKAAMLALVDVHDQISGDSLKAKLIKEAVGRSFVSTHRLLRQELIALDGATLIDAENGDLLAVGAIIKVPAGSQEGGRQAAARALAAHGLGIKVSQDGPIMVYSGQGTSAREFRIG